MKRNKQTDTASSQKRLRFRQLDGWNKAAIVFLTLVLIGCVTVFTMLVSIVNSAPEFQKNMLVAETSSKVYDRDGNLIAELGSEHRDNIEYEDLPQDLIDAFLAIEDSRFFTHNGFDLPRFLKSAMNNLKSGSLSQGGSTLTMQLVDNTWIAEEMQQMMQNGQSVSKFDSIKLKIQEIYLSLLTEQNTSKEDIIVNYLNRIWFGSSGGTRGVQKAAEYYFDKDVNDLNLSECAFLAGVINAPYTYSPYNLAGDEQDHYANATKRRNETLAMMLQHGYISEQEYQLAKSTNLAYQLKQSASYDADPYQSYVEQAVAEVRTLTGKDPYTTPMDIYTGMDSEAQKTAYEASIGQIVTFPNQYFNSGISVVDNATGEILAMGPGKLYVGDSTNRNAAIETQQPGSAMKPLIAYAPTFDVLGWSTTHTVEDKKGDYFHVQRNLENFDGKYMGKMSLADALGLSRNTTAAQAMQNLIDAKGNAYWIDYLKQLGFSDAVAEAFNIQYCIGGSEMRASPVEMASAYSTLANSGQHVDAHCVRKAVIRETNETIKSKPETSQPLSEGAAYMITTLCEKVVSGGYDTLNYLMDGDGSYPVYGKSGTSDWGEFGSQYGIPNGVMKDEWAIGYTSEVSVAVWTGYTDTGIKNGYYITTDVLYQGIASKLARVMLDATKENPTDVARPSSVVKKASGDGGWILDQYYNSEESRSSGMEDDPKGEKQKEKEELEKKCKADPTSDPKCDGYEEAMKEKKEKEKQEKEAFDKKCAADPTSDPKCPGYAEAMKQKEEEANKAACAAQGGTWNNGVCTLPTPPDSGEDDKPDDDTPDDSLE